ncbi:hypothetical protein [Vibrio sp. WXL210]|uniref:hypothetical protein n=1 Tax=Vibrio sp. WXL210 TaxID=3450709 RepID=UPI003EC65912
MEKLTTALRQLTIAINNLSQALSEFSSQSTIQLANEPKHSIIPEPVTDTVIAKPVITSDTNSETHDFPERIAQWFQKYQLGFDHFNPAKGETNSSRKIALLLAKQFADCHEMVALLNRMSDGNRNIVMDLRNHSVETIASCCALSHALNEAGFLQQRSYKKSPVCRLNLRSNGLPVTKSFFNGRWFEQAVDMQLAALCERYKEMCWTKNIVVRTAQGQQREMDFILSFHKQVFVIEVTIGAWQKKATQMLSMANKLSIPVRQCVVISPGTYTSAMDEFSQLHGCQVITFSRLEHWLESLDNQSSKQIDHDDIIDMETYAV